MVLSMKRAEVVREYGGISATDRRAERRRKLLAAGRRTWGESGVTEVTVRGVCNEAGLTSRYFYEQFPNREALLFAISDDVRDQLLEALVVAGIGDPGTLGDKLRSALTEACRRASLGRRSPRQPVRRAVDRGRHRRWRTATHLGSGTARRSSARSAPPRCIRRGRSPR